MADSQENKQKEQKDASEKNFMIEKIKERPVNKKKLLRRTLITASMAVIFGLVACFTFLVLEPVISNWLYPEEEPQVVVFPEDQDEMSPEQMLTENMQQENQNNQSFFCFRWKLWNRSRSGNCYPESYWTWIIISRFTTLLPVCGRDEPLHGHCDRSVIRCGLVQQCK